MKNGTPGSPLVLNEGTPAAPGLSPTNGAVESTAVFLTPATGVLTPATGVLAPATGAPLTVAYLINQYPAVSHSFIRREIVALEQQGVVVKRFSIRPPPAALVDPADVLEQGKTREILRAGALGLLHALLSTLAGTPGAWLRAFRAALRLGGRSDRGRLRHVVYLAEACLLLRWLRADNVTHLHAHFGTNPAAVALLTRILGGPPYSFTVHGPDEFDHPAELSLGEKIAGAAAVIAVSEFGKSQLYRWIPHTEWPKVHVVRCGVDAAFLAAGPQPLPDTRRMVCIGRLSEQKGQLLILEALAVLSRQGVEFEMVLAGDGPMRGVVEERIRAFGLGSKVRITGWVSNDIIRRELLAARVLLLPSFAEGLPVALMEALALGRPAVTTYVAGIPELVSEGVNGWLIPAGSVPAMVRAIGQALQTPISDLQAMGRAGAAAVAERHNVDREAARLLAIFNSPAGTPPANQPSADAVALP